MSFLGQSIRNNFPLWSKIRRDDSSVGAMIFDSIGEELEDTRVGILQAQKQNKPLSNSPVFEPSSIYAFNLNESQEFLLFKNENELYRSLVAEATIGNETIALRNIFSYSKLAKAATDRIGLSLSSREEYLLDTIEKSADNNFLQRSITSSFSLNKEPRQIYFNIYNSENYETVTYNRNMYDKRYIVIRGTNIFGKRIEETISVAKEGLYKTLNIFRTIEPLAEDLEMSISGGASIECYGFDGTIEVMRFPLQIQRKAYPFKILVKKVDELNHQGSLEEASAEFEVSSNKHSGEDNVLRYIFKAYENSEVYINSRTSMEKEYFEQAILEQELLNESFEPIQVQDFWFDYVRDQIVVIDQNASIYWYDLFKSNFEKPEINRTKKTNITFETEKQQVILNETLPMFASLERAKGNVAEVIIAKQKPSFKNRVIDENQELITNFNFEYLQDDFTWSETKNFFSGRDVEDIYLNFEGKTIDVLFDEYGQHDFYIMSFASQFNQNNSLTKFIDGDIDESEFKLHLNKYLKDEYQETVLIDTYSVNCEYKTPLRSFDTDILTTLEGLGETAEEYSLGVFFEGIDNTLHVIASDEESTFIYKIKEYKDCILFDYYGGNGALLEEYDSVNIIINDSYEEELT